MRIDHKDFYAEVVKSEGGISYYVIQGRWNNEVIYCGQSRSKQEAIEAATAYLEDLSGGHYPHTLAS